MSTLESKVQIPRVAKGANQTYHINCIKAVHRNQLKEFLRSKGILTEIHYPIPPHLQIGLRHLGYKKGNFPIAEELADVSLSLPIFYGIKNDQISYICNQIKEFYNQ